MFFFSFVCSTGLVDDCNDGILTIDFLECKGSCVRNDRTFIWPKTKYIDKIAEMDILCKIPRCPIQIGTKTRTVYKFLDTDNIDDLLGN